MITASNMVADYYKNQPGMGYNPPWIQIGGIILLAYISSQVMTILPAVRAARIYPAEALRFE